jgi:hypothetical protein
MTPYRDWDHDSGVRAYEIGSDSIIIQFKDGSKYLYTSLTPGRQEIEHMARLAKAGEGLNSYITKTIKRRYARKIT